MEINEDTSSSSSIHPNATLTPDASLGAPTNWTWLESKDSTSAPLIGEKLEEEMGRGVKYAGSYPELLEKHVLSRYSLPFVAFIIIFGFIFIQDNRAGELASWQGILWTILKAAMLIVLLILILIGQWVYKKILIYYEKSSRNT